MKHWKCNICEDIFHTDGDVHDEAVEHTITFHMNYEIIKGEEKAEVKDK